MLKATAIGFIGNDATIKIVGDKKVINFSIAHTETWKDNQGVKNARTTWIECAMWERENLAPFLKKGAQVFVEGAVSPNAWSDKEGVLQTSLRLKVYQLQLLGKKEKTNENADGNNANTSNGENNDGNFTQGVVDDLSF